MSAELWTTAVWQGIKGFLKQHMPPPSPYQASPLPPPSPVFVSRRLLHALPRPAVLSLQWAYCGEVHVLIMATAIYIVTSLVAEARQTGLERDGLKQKKRLKHRRTSTSHTAGRMGLAVRVRSAGQKYGPTCHPRCELRIPRVSQSNRCHIGRQGCRERDYFRTTVFFPANFVTLLAVIWLDGEHYFSPGMYTPNIKL